MPTIRHQIRNEYGLGSSKLYAVADKDDPEAILESIAVAGLVGLLRQLGELAEVAAEVFHSLHEEITSTASRGHKLMARVQQLEAEVPSIEKVMFRDNASSCLSYYEGIDWCCNLQMDHNLITTGNMPHFIMDTYEECRGPPEFFNLDKFDTAGAGACLKRYSDPSFYRMELTSRFGDQDVQREKRASKVKSKVSFSCNGDSPESFTRTHTNSRLQPHTSDQVFGETLKHVKLKHRRLNESVIYNLRSSMGNIADLHPRGQQEISETSISKSIMTKSFESSGNEKGIHEIGAYASSDVEEGPRPFPTRQDMTPASDSEKKKTERKGLSGTQFEPANTNKTEGHSAVEEVHQNGFFTAACSSVNSSDGYVSDEISSEFENYVDALTTMESELETATENKNKLDSVFVSIETPGTDSDTNDEQYELNAQQARQYLLENSPSSPGFSTIFRKGTTDPFFSDTLGHMAAQLLEKNKSRIPSNSDIISGENSSISIESASDKKVKSKLLGHLPFSGICIVEAPNVPSSAVYGEAYFSSNTGALSTIPLATEGMDEASSYCESETDQAVDISQISSGEKTNMAFGELKKEDGESYSVAETFILDVELGDVTANYNVLASSKLVPPLENFDALTQGKNPISIISSKEEILCSSDESEWSDEETNDVTHGPPHIVDHIVLPHKTTTISDTLEHAEPIESCKDQDSSSPCIVPAELLDINDTSCLKPPRNYFLENSKKSSQDVFLRKVVRTFKEAYRKESSTVPGSVSDLEEGQQLESSALNFIEDTVSKQRSTSIYPTEVIDEILVESSENKNLFDSSSSMLFPFMSANEHIITSETHALHSEDSSELLVGDNPNLILPHDSNDIELFARISYAGIELLDGTLSSQAAGPQITTSDDNLSNISNSQVPNVIMQQSSEDESELASSLPHLENGATSEDNQEVSKIAQLSPISWRLVKPSLDPLVPSSGATEFPSTLSPVCQQEPSQMLLVEGVEIANSDSTEQFGKSYHIPAVVVESHKHDNLFSNEQVMDQILESLVEEDKEVSDTSACGAGNDAHPSTFVEVTSSIDEPSPSSEIQRPENGSANLDRESSTPFLVVTAYEDAKLCHQVPGSVINAKLPPLPMPIPKKSGNGSLSIEEMNSSSLHDSTTPTPEPPRKLHSVFIKPNDPLIEAIASHDKSKLRKAPDLVHSSAMPNCDERGSFLEQIRNKTFSLRPTVAPTIKFKGGPPTNVKVIAILEKANAIRQACAGSDDDDEDSWSDS